MALVKERNATSTRTRLSRFPAMPAGALCIGLATAPAHAENGRMADRTNVLGGSLECCCREPLTGFYRDGYCRTGPGDHGVHTVCIVATDEFLAFSQAAGNDLSTPMPAYQFPGLSEGDRWCLCAARWQEALEAGCAPPVVLEASHISSLEFIALEDLREHAVQV